jgi:signal transduction histidine kinase/DNA-binding response OmpR family regulator
MPDTPVRILILDDRPTDRLFLSTLLGYAGYTVVQAANGEEGLQAAADHLPDLVISDVLMPRMDGYEFVRRLRRTPAGADVPVLFYTATYHEEEAHALADEVGVVEVLTKPSQPEVILARVDAIVRRGRRHVAPIEDASFDRHHARITTAKLIDKIRELEASEQRLSAIVDLGQRLLEERHPVALLDRVCTAIRDTTHARHAVVALFDAGLRHLTLVLTSGHDDRTAEFLRSGRALPDVLRRVATDRRPLRDRVPPGRPDPIGLPPWHETVNAYMFVPLASRGRVYGVIAVTGKEDGDAFTAADEQVAVTLGVQAGMVYENAVLINELESRTAALREDEATTDFALKAAGVGIYQRDLTTGRVKLSKGLSEAIALPADASPEDIYALVHRDDRDQVRARIAEATAAKRDFVVDFRASEDAGRGGDWQMRGKVLADAAGSPSRVIAVAIDMTERRQLEAQLRQAQKMEAIGRLAGGVAHDFNNLLTAILGYSRFLLPGLADDQQRSDVGEIIKAGERATALTRQLLAVSRRQAQELSVFDLNALISDLATMLTRLLGENVQLMTELGEPLAHIHADRGQIEQVIMNLVVNAADAMPSGGAVRIRTATVGRDGADWVSLSVIDTGTGMTEETKARLFDPFFTTKQPGKGTGLGLATVLGIVSQSGGHVLVDTTLRRGSTFAVLLPPAADRAAASAPAEVAVAGGTETVLLAEDERAVRYLARVILERAGYQVLESESVAQAKGLARDHPFDLLVTDVVMADGTGPDLYRHVAAERPDLRVLYMSGYAQEAILDTRHLDQGAAFLTKPFTAEALTRKVREVLDR